ncbi:MAG: arginine--tRNA ligase [Saprospiraceae bacterium]
MEIVSRIKSGVAKALQESYGLTTPPEEVLVSPTSAAFEGDFTVVLFPFVKATQKSPDEVGRELGERLQAEIGEVARFGIVKGFLNISLDAAYWSAFLQTLLSNPQYGRAPATGRKVLVEFSSPNTNKPLHLGHVRNILLGWSCSQLLEAAGDQVHKVQIINDRGVAICKSMLAWQLYAEGRTPESEGVKSDHFVGDYYVLFEQKTKAEYDAWKASEEAAAVFAQRKKSGESEADFFKRYKNDWFNERSALGRQVRDMLLRWEAGDPDTLALWRQMNDWVYAGFDRTYDALGVSFDKLYYESDTFKLGKDIVDEGLAKGVFFKKEDGSVWVDLSDAGYDQKLVLRADGTSVYITQDLGTARMRYNEFGCDSMVYVVADEQNYHFGVLFEILKRLGEPYAAGLYHLAYGLVELPTGRMKTREGTVVDADDLMEEVVRVARSQQAERGESGSEDDLRKIALGAMKFFMIKVHPKKKMIFNPEESLDLQGQTGPYVQYSYVRINGLMERVQREDIDLSPARDYTAIQAQERELLKALHEYPELTLRAAREYDPSLIANHAYALAKSYHRLWHDLPIFNADTPQARAFRLTLSKAVAQVLRSAMSLLGIEMPRRM